jgi:hypothetical protein
VEGLFTLGPTRLSNDTAPGQPIAAPALVAGYIGLLRSLDRRDEVSLTPDDSDYYQVSLLSQAKLFA